MVGSAQYRDEEIAWVLTAVVEKQNQEYIQENFESIFGRPLNHNQIRYIKNKYGKDPKFNSPLVNIRSCKLATSPPSSVLGSNDQDDAVSTATTTPSERQRRRDCGQVIIPRTSSQTKRKRSLEDDGRKSSIRNVPRMQRSNLLAHVSNTLTGTMSDMAQWNTIGTQAATSLHSLSPTPVTSEGLYASLGVYDARQQLMQGTGGVTWAPSMNDVWSLGEHPSLINTSRHSGPSTVIRNLSSSPVELNYFIGQTPASYAGPSPARTFRGCSQLSQPFSAIMSPQSFSPSLQDLVYTPNFTTEPQNRELPRLQTQLQPQAEVHCHSILDLSANLPLTISSIVENLASGTKQETRPEALDEPPLREPVPSFEELPILPADYTHSPGGTVNPWLVACTPYEPLPFDPIPGQMPWPFENVRDVGLTAISSVDIRKEIQERERRRRENGDLDITLDSALNTSENMDGTTGTNAVKYDLEMLDLARECIPRETQADAAQYAAAVYARALASSLAAESPPRTAATEGQEAPAADGAKTIDPSLLSDLDVAASLTLACHESPGMSHLEELLQAERNFSPRTL